MYRKFGLISLILLSTVNILFASQVKIVNQSRNTLMIEYQPEFNGFDELSDMNGVKIYEPKIQGAFIEETTTGSPAKMVYTVNVLVPGKDKFHMTRSDIVGSKFFNKTIVPTPVYDYSDLSYDYNADLSKYKSVDNSPLVELNYLGIARGQHLAQLKFIVAQNNNGKIQIPEKFVVELNFDAEIDKNGAFRKTDEMIEAINKDQALFWKNSNSDIKLLGDNDYENISSGNWYRIRIKEEGIYKITASKLADMGIENSSDLANTIKVFGHGGKNLSEYVPAGVNNEMNEQPIIVNKKSNGELDNIIFYAAGTTGFEYKSNQVQHYINTFSEDNFYLLTYGGRDGMRAVEVAPPDGNVENRFTKYTKRIFFEEELQNPYPHGGGTQWFGQSFFESPFINKLDNLDRSSDVFYRISVAHKSEKNSGYFTVAENNIDLGKIYLGSTGGDYTHADREITVYDLPASNIASDNRSKLELTYKNNGTSGYNSYLDYYEIHFVRDMLALDNEISMISGKYYEGVSEYTANGFTGDKIYGFDVTYKNSPKMLKNLATTGGMFIFKDLVDDPAKSYYISSKIKTPDISTIEISGLRTDYQNTDVIVITHKDLMESANNYKKYREENSNLTVSVVTTEAIYNEFSSSLPDLTAIRDFLAFAYRKWATKPKYVVLWGDGHYDYKHISTSATNYVPVYQYRPAKSSFDEINYDYASEDYYTRIVGDDEIADIAIGRITINSNEEGNKAIEKIKHYEQNSSQDYWRTEAILVADDGPTDDGSDGATHNNQSEDLADLFIDSSFSKDKIYLVEYERNYLGGEIRKPDVTKDLLSAVNTHSGLFLNWVGHGNPSVWAHERILERDIHIKQFTNWDKLFFLTAATCDYGRFDNPDAISGSELFFLSEYGGAIGVFSATRVVLSQSNAAINNLLYSILFTRDENGEYPTLGTAMMKVKQQRDGTNDEKFFLLGDPTLKLLIPEYSVRIDSVNGVSTTDEKESFNFEALADMRISGSIVNPMNNKLLNDFNGNVILNIHEGDKYYDLIEPEDPDHFLYTKEGAALNRGSYKVENGKFVAEFIIPKDISFSDSLGRMYSYAYSDDDRYAKGLFRKYSVNGISTGIQNDGKGPAISIYLDDRSFNKYDYVRSEPLLIIDLFDETGINTTGLGIGHKIEAWIDDNPISIDLTEKFSSSINDSRYGTAQDYLSELDAGVHRVKVRAWDVYNNYTETETYFRVASNEQGYFITEHMNYPNPFNTSTTIKFKYNVSPPFDARISIYTSIGQKVSDYDLLISNSLSAEVEWDGYDDSGNKMPAGMYIYKIDLTDAEGNKASETGNMILLGN